MSYVHKVISRQEKLLYVFRPHWIYVLNGFFWFALLTCSGLVVDYHFYQYIGAWTFLNIDFWSVYLGFKLSGIAIIFSVMGLMVFWTYTLAYISAEIGLTDQRIISKKGLIFIEVDQVDLEDIRAEQVFHGWFGWILGYGRVHLDCRFIQDVWLPTIADPYRLIKASHNARFKHPVIEYGHDEFQENMRRIEENQHKGKMTTVRIVKLKQAVKNRFYNAASK